MSGDPEFPLENETPSAWSKSWSWPWILAGAIYGVFLRILFGALPGSLSGNGVMSAAFLIGAPVIAGAITVHAARDRDPPISYVIFGPWISIALMLIGCAITLLEGSICIALLSPLFLVFGSIGGVLMALIQKFSKRNDANLGAVAILPFALLVGEENSSLTEREMEIRQSVVIEADADRIWREILDARDIRPEELPFSITHMIGVPRPVEGINRETPEGEIRFSTWERGVNFQGIVTERKESETIRWSYRFDSHSFPKGSMDEHVAIGGRFFDLQDTRFNLIAVSAERTELEIVAQFRVSSSINFYAVPAARFLGRDFVNTILGLYKTRSEAAAPDGDLTPVSR